MNFLDQGLTIPHLCLPTVGKTLMSQEHIRMDGLSKSMQICKI